VSTAPARAQQERSREVRKVILDAAVDVLVAEGYAQATTLKIQERAGVSRGRLLHHFPSRDDLLVAAAHHLATERMTETRESVDWPAEPAARIDAAIDVIGLSYGQAYFWAATELWVAARVHDDLKTALFPAEQQLGSIVRDDTARYFGEELAAHPLFSTVRDMLHTSLRGAALTTAFDHRPQTLTHHIEKLKRLTHALLLDTPTPEEE